MMKYLVAEMFLQIFCWTVLRELKRIILKQIRWETIYCIENWNCEIQKQFVFNFFSGIYPTLCIIYLFLHLKGQGSLCR